MSTLFTSLFAASPVIGLVTYGLSKLRLRVLLMRTERKVKQLDTTTITQQQEFLLLRLRNNVLC
ncbi:hypothetical protein [Candidatus Doolittlea endobia]|nr:hypothetical protein [Candidatus Doolittlea endobia]